MTWRGATFGAVLAGAVAIAAVAVVPRRALAVSPEVQRLEALRDLKEGNRLYDGGDYLGALARFERAYATVPSPRLFFNFGQTYRRLGRTIQALEFYERFLAEATGVQPQLRLDAQGWVDELTKAVATVDVRVDGEGAEVTVDGRSYGMTPLARPVRVAPGSHQIVVQTRGGAAAPYIGTFHAQAGQRVAVDARLPKVVASQEAPPPPAPKNAERPSARVAVAPPQTPAEQVAKAAPPQRADHSRRLGLFLRADVDRQLAGAGVAGGLTYGLADQLRISAGGFLWPAGGLRIAGASLGLTVYFLPGAVRPMLTAEAQTYFRGGAHFGSHAAAGVQWDMNTHAGLFATVGVQYTSTEIVTGERSLFFVPSLGTHLRF